MTRRSVAVLFDQFGPYHVARLRAAARQLQVIGIEFFGRSAAYAWEATEEVRDVNRVTLLPTGDRTTVPTDVLTTAVRKQLSTSGPDAVAVPGWTHPGSLAALQWCAQHKKPAIMMSETAAIDFDRVWWKEAIKRRLIAQCSAGLVGGPAHRAYLSALGLPRDRVFLGYDVVDNAHFAQGAAEVQSNATSERTARNLPDRYFLASNRFVPKKNLLRLIKAFAFYRQRAPRESAWDLVLLGDGELRPSIESTCQALGLEGVVHLPGFKQYGALPAYYGLAGAFVHASTREQWGLVVNEAMASGLPVVVSERCGCAEVLVEDEGNGFTFDPYDVKALANRLLCMAHGKIDRSAMGLRSREVISSWGPEAFGTGMRHAVKAASSRTRFSTSLASRILLKALAYQ